MCRFIAYQGEPILLETLVTLPSHSLVRQSTHASHGVTSSNADGFGLGWYDELGHLETYHNKQPAWADSNLPLLCERVNSGSFFAHVRATTGTEVTRNNCHPFTNGRLLFMHNGQISGWTHLKDQVGALLPSSLRALQRGTTDSEAIFLSALADGLEHEPVASIERTLARLMALKGAFDISGPLRFAAAISDGETLWAFRWACDARPPTLFYRIQRGGVTVASEPTDHALSEWNEVPSGTCLVVKRGGPLPVVPLVVRRQSGFAGITRESARWPATLSLPNQNGQSHPGSAPNSP